MSVITWLYNGFLVVAFYMVDYIWVVTLFGMLIFMFVNMETFAGNMYKDQMRQYLMFAGALSLAAALYATHVVSLAMVIMTLVTIIALLLKWERMNPSNVVWGYIRMIVIYALIGIGITALQQYLNVVSDLSDPGTAFLAQGQNYLTILASIAVFLFPVGYVGFLFKELFLTKPEPIKGGGEAIMKYGMTGKK